MDNEPAGSQPRQISSGEAVAMRSATGAALPPHPLDKQWFAHVDGKSYGPYTGHEINKMIASNQITESDHLCAVDGSAWVLARSEPILGALFQNKRQAASNIPATVTANGGTIVQVTNNIPQPNYAALLLDGGIPKPKSPGVALLFSFFICGTGQMYNGQVGKGFAMLFGCVALWFIWLGWIIWIWGLIDAYTTAKDMNLRYQRLLLSGMVQP
jgi:TM2 domain-containing membrane protein YozV